MITEKSVYQEKGIGKEGVEEDGPAEPAGSPLASAQNLGDRQGDDDADEFVAGVCDEVKELRVIAYIQDIHGHFQHHNLE